MAEQKESFTEKVLRSVLISSKGGVVLQKLNHEFKELLGQEIPYRDNGFPNLEAYLRSMPKVVAIKRDPSGQIMCMGVANEETQHLDRLVKKQKSSKKKGKPARLPRFSSRPSTRPRRPPHNFRGNQQYPPAYQRRPDYYAPQQQRNPQPFHQRVQQPPAQRYTQPQAQRSQQPSPQKKQYPPSQRNQQPLQQRNQQPYKGKQQQQQHQHQQQQSSSYEVPPRFRRQIYSTGGNEIENRLDAPPPLLERSRSAGDYQSAVVDNRSDYHEQQQPEQPPQPPQPPPVDDHVVSWVNEVLADKTGGLWLSGLRKLYKEKFQESLQDDLVEKLSRLSLWTSEEIGVVGNDKILYPNLRVEVTKAPSSGNVKRNVFNKASNTNYTVPTIVLPDEELWEVYVSYVISVVDFYCIIVGEEYSDRLCALEDEMREFYVTDRYMSLTERPVVGGLYAAQLTDDWLRVKVIMVEDDDEKAGCFLVDHGDIESVPLKDLRHLNQDFLQLAVQAIPCKLHGLDAKAANETATTRFCNTAVAQTRLAEVISREPKVSLTLYRDRLNINYLCALGE